MEQINWVHRCMIVPAALQAQCQAIPGASGMWTTGLSLDGAAPATNYISAGLVEQAFADLLTSPVALSVATGYTLEESHAIVDGMRVSEGDPHAAMQEMGLALVVEDEA